MKSHSYSAPLLGTTVAGEQFRFAIANASPIGLRASLSSVAPEQLFVDAPGSSERFTVGPIRWGQRVVGFDQVGTVGDEGWEAVNVFGDYNNWRVLLKRRL